MTEQQPYPTQIVEAVAKGINPEAFAERLGRHPDDIRYAQSRAMQRAEGALSALWEASRVVDVDQLPDDAVYLNDLGGIGFVGAARGTCEVDRMEHILHWGDHK